MIDVIDEIIDALEHEPRVMLATIIATNGSTPAAAFSKMLVKQGGTQSVGTVGGGCMEGNVILHANRMYGGDRASIVTFHLNEDDIEHGLICGGSLDVLLEPVGRDRLTLLGKLKQLQDDGQDTVLATSLDAEGRIACKVLFSVPGAAPVVVSPEGADDRGLLSDALPDLQEILGKVYRRQETHRAKLGSGELVFEPIPGRPTLILFGGGHVSKYIARTASMVGFRVTVVDDRGKYANPGRFPEAAATLAVDFADAFSRLSVRPSTYVVIVTRGHRYDGEILARALNTSARYIGMIGSKRKVLTTYRHLVDAGTDPDALGRVHAPIGIEIGAVTAEEIAVSVVAQLIRVRRGEALPLRDKSDALRDRSPGSGLPEEPS